MTDRYDQDMILGYVEGELDDAQRETFEATLADDHELRNLVSQMKLDRENLRALGQTTAPYGLIDQVIQTQERAELLGDPDAPEPLPLKMPVGSHRFGRVLVYSGIAAVLLLSAALVVPTLIPSGLLNHQPQYAINETTTESDDALTSKDDAEVDGPVDDVAPGESLTRSVAPIKTTDSNTISKTTIADAAETKERTDKKIDQPQPTLADAGPVATEELAEEQTAPDMPTEVLVSRDVTFEAMTPETELTGDADSADRATPVDPTPGEGVLVMTEPVKEADETTPTPAIHTAAVDAETGRVAKAGPVARNPFMSYDNDDSPAITERTQLLVNTASPTLARRDIRDWAMTNSVVVVEEPADPSIHNRAVAAGGAGQPVTHTQLVVEIKEEQLPELLVYLNRAPSQQAQLVTLADTPTRADGDTDRRLIRRAEDRPVRDNDRADTHDAARAMANRPTEIHTTRPGVGIVSGLASTQPAPSVNQAEPQPEVAEDETPTENETQPDSQPAKSQPFDWGSIFDSLTVKPIQPPTPLLQPEPSERLHLQVIIQQVADEVPTEDKSP